MKNVGSPLVFLCLAGCGGAAVDPSSAQKVERLVEKAQSPLPVRHVALWKMLGDSDDMLCGEIEAPEKLKRFRSTLRYVYSSHSKSEPITFQPHELLLAPDPRGDQIIAEAGRMFDKVWDQNCQPYAPVGRRVASWFGGTPAGDGQTDTPLANAYVEDLLNRR